MRRHIRAEVTCALLAFVPAATFRANGFYGSATVAATLTTEEWD